MREIKRQLEQGASLVNGNIERFGSKKLSLGDQVSWSPPAEEPLEKRPLKLLLEWGELIALDKSPGLASDSKEILTCLGSEPLFPVHRLDKQTSGVLLLARGPETASELGALFRKRHIEKTYLAIVDSLPDQAAGEIRSRLGKKGYFEGQTLWGSVIAQEGKESKTGWELLCQGESASLLSCFPKTGRTHQIRVHLSEMGHPILGDYQYAKSYNCPYKPCRLLLHAHTLRFVYRGKPVLIKASPPRDFTQAMSALRLRLPNALAH